jgi:hypothetical protein
MMKNRGLNPSCLLIAHDALTNLGLTGIRFAFASLAQPICYRTCELRVVLQQLRTMPGWYPRDEALL